MADEPRLWRKKRRGKEYGSFHAYVGSRIVNLGTDVFEMAAQKTKHLLAGGGAAATADTAGAARAAAAPGSGLPDRAAAAPAPTGGRSYLADWAARPVGGPPAPAASPLAAPAAPAPLVLSPSMRALAEGIASAVAKANAAAVAVAVKHLAHVQPPKIEPDEVESLEKAWATGVEELMAIYGIKWWHVVIAQNAALAANLIAAGTPIAKPQVAPVADRQ